MSTLAAIVTLSLPAQSQEGEKVPCFKVVAELNHRISRNQDRDPKKIAKRLDTDPDWVVECLRLSGRRISGPSFATDGEEATPGPFDPNQLDDPSFPGD